MKYKGVLFFFLMAFFGCVNHSSKKITSSKYGDDLKRFELSQIVKSPVSKEFIAIFHDASSSLSGNNLLKLYSEDSSSIGELYYGAHPLEISSWSGSSITLNACMYSAHGDSTYRKWALDNSVDKNLAIGKYKLSYNKNYNCTFE
jgi:hypothetical protein